MGTWVLINAVWYKTQIERYSLEAQTALVSEGLTTEAAQTFLTNMPPVETLMPTLDASEIKGLIESKAA